MARKMETEIVEEINQYLKGIEGKLNIFQKEARKIIEIEAHKTFENIKKSAPYFSGGLKKSMCIVPLKGLNTEQNTARGESYWGYKIEFRGETKWGVSYESLARTLNDGHGDYINKNGHHFGAITGTYFISKHISKLKSLDKKIYNKFEELIKQGVGD